MSFTTCMVALLLSLFAQLTACRDLSATIHQHAIDNLGATFNLIGTDGNGCPTSVKHSISDGGIPHSGVLVQGSFCTSTGSAQIFKTDAMGDFDRAAAAIPASFVAGNNLLKNVFENAPGAVVAVDATDRTCGSYSFPKGTVSAFILNTAPVVVAPGKSLPDGFWLVIASPERLGLCIYNGPRHNPRNGDKSPSGPPSGPASGGGKDGGNSGTVSGNGNTGGHGNGDGAVNWHDNGNGKRPVSVTTPIPIGRGQQSEFRYHDESCFPAEARVNLEDGTSKAMRDVQIGDRVKVAPGVYSPVFMFTHRVPGTRGPFVQLSTSDGSSLVLTAGHYLHVNGELVPAKSVKVGDLLQNENGVAVQVQAVDVVIRKGLFNPQTVHGDIIVEGIRTSTYTTAVNPEVAHSLLAPFRALFEWTGSSVGLLEGGAHAPAPVNVMAMQF